MRAPQRRWLQTLGVYVLIYAGAILMVGIADHFGHSGYMVLTAGLLTVGAIAIIATHRRLRFETMMTEEQDQAYTAGYSDGNVGMPLLLDEFSDPILQFWYEKGWRDATDE